MATVYDKSGKAFECEAVDAKELIASGAYSESAPKAEKPKEKPEPKSAKKK